MYPRPVKPSPVVACILLLASLLMLAPSSSRAASGDISLIPFAEYLSQRNKLQPRGRAVSIEAGIGNQPGVRITVDAETGQKKERGQAALAVILGEADWSASKSFRLRMAWEAQKEWFAGRLILGLRSQANAGSPMPTLVLTTNVGSMLPKDGTAVDFTFSQEDFPEVDFSKLRSMVISIDGLPADLAGTWSLIELLGQE